MRIRPWWVVPMAYTLCGLRVRFGNGSSRRVAYVDYVDCGFLFFLQIGRVEVTCFQSIFSDATTSHTRHEVPLDLIPCVDLQPTTLQALRSLPESLLAEERELLAMAQETSSKELQVTVHNSSIYTAAICRLLDRICAPILRYVDSTQRTQLFVNLTRLVHSLKIPHLSSFLPFPFLS